METGKERLFRVIGDVGSDLVDTAENKVFPRSAGRRLLPAAACLAVLVGLTCLALPYLQQTPQQEPAATEAPPSLEQTTELPADETQLPQTEEDQNRKQQQDAAVPVQPKEQLVFWDTIYYVEAVYTPEQAEMAAGDYLGTVQAADDETLVGAPVYMRLASATRADSKEREVPLEIFVQDGAQYLYCLTYYAPSGPIMDYRTAADLWSLGEPDYLASALLTPLEQCFYGGETPLEYRDAGELTPEQLLRLFLATLQAERLLDQRTGDLDRYLWYDGSEYVIPTTDIRRQLNRYLDGYDWRPEELPGYRADLEAVVLEQLAVDLTPEAVYVVLDPESSALDAENRTLTLVGDRYQDVRLAGRRCYQLRFTDNGCILEAVYTLKD